MKRVLLLVPVLTIPPALVAAYFLYLAPPSVRWAAQTASAHEDNLQAARTAYERASRLVSQVRTGKGSHQELLRQAVVQYRVCLAYEAGTADAGRLFDEARQNLEVSRLLFVQGQAPAPPIHPTGGTTVYVKPPPPVQPTPIARGESKPQPLPSQTTATLRDAEGESNFAAAGKPIPESRPTEAEARPVKTTAVGPDGVTFEPVDKNPPPKE